MKEIVKEHNGKDKKAEPGMINGTSSIRERFENKYACTHADD